jgi:hypothetical protein
LRERIAAMGLSIFVFNFHNNFPPFFSLAMVSIYDMLEERITVSSIEHRNEKTRADIRYTNRRVICSL